MAIKERVPGRYDVELRGQHIKRVRDKSVARMLESAGKRLLELGKPLEEVKRELRGEGPSVAPTLDAYSEAWFGSQNVAASTLHDYRNKYKRAQPFVGSLRVDLIGVGDMRRLIKSLSASGLAPSTVNSSVGVVKAMLSDACDDGLRAARLPPRIKGTPTGVATVRPGRALTREEHGRIVAHTPRRLRDLFEVWPWVGLRISEIIALEWDSIEEGRLWVVRQHTEDGVTKASTKTKKDRYVELCGPSRRVLDRMERLTPLVFPATDGGYLSHDVVRRALAKACLDAGVAPVHPHLFRHTYGSRLLAAGYSVTYVAARMGHAPTMLLKTYAHDLEQLDAQGPGKLDIWAGNGDGMGTDDEEG